MIPAFLPVLFTAGLHVVVIGDSHTVGPMGRRLDDQLRQNPSIQSVETFAVCGARANAFTQPVTTSCGLYEKEASGFTLDVLAGVSPEPARWGRTKPDAVIVVLGTNLIPLSDWKVAAKEVQGLLSEIRALGSRCFWVLPPSMSRFEKELPALEVFLQNEVGLDCEVFQSSKVTAYPKGEKDGVHYSSKALTPLAEAWADEIFAALRASWGI